MRSSYFGCSLCGSALIMLMALSGCESTLVEPGEDAGPTVLEDGGAPPPDDGGSPPPDGGECATDADCADDDPCTETFCEASMCWARRVSGCADCASDADCDDGFFCSIEHCVGGVCSFDWRPECECLDATQCDDGNPTTIDRCTSDWRCVHEAMTCATDAECDDADRCTSDACVDAACVSTRIPGCGTTSCPDRDGDGHGTQFCFGGDDCDDANPAVHPGATEICDDGVDNDYDGATDLVDTACAPSGGTCASAAAIVPGTRVDGAVITDGTGGTGTSACGTSSFHTLTLTETSDVEITLSLMEPPPPTPVPGCPECTPPHEWEYWFNAFLEQTCGDATTDVGGASSGCRVWSTDSFFGGDGTMTRLLRRVPAGTYTVDVQASDWRGWMPAAIRFSLDVSVTASDSAACGSAGALASGVSVTGRTGSGTDAFDSDCRGTPVVAEESLYTFTLPGRRRVRLEAVGEVDPAIGVAPGLRLGLFDACDPAATRVSCLENTGRECHERATLEATLDAGTYWVVVEATSGGDVGYALTLDVAGATAACRDAPVIAASGVFSGDTTSRTDAFRDAAVCGDGYGPDAVYRVDVATEQRVVLDLIASYPDALLTLYQGCGEARVAGGGGRTRVDLTLLPGTYHAVVGGEHATDAGSYVLNATFVASP
ncbi:MAG: putative metal-binding motif-containing protein [Sandaracinaceae bacterium]